MMQMRFSPFAAIASCLFLACAQEEATDGDLSADDQNIAVEGKPAAPPANFRELLTKDGKHQGLYAGGHLHKENVAYMKRLGVKTVISLQPVEEDIAYDHEVEPLGWITGKTAEQVRVEKSGMEFQRHGWSVFINKIPQDRAFYDGILKVMRDPSKQPVYIHCEKGFDRTGAMVALHRIVDEKWLPAKAFREWRDERHGCMNDVTDWSDKAFNHYLNLLHAANSGKPGYAGAYRFQILPTPEACAGQ